MILHIISHQCASMHIVCLFVRDLKSTIAEQAKQKCTLRRKCIESHYVPFVVKLCYLRAPCVIVCMYQLKFKCNCTYHGQRELPS